MTSLVFVFKSDIQPQLAYSWTVNTRVCTMMATAVTATKYYGHEPRQWRPQGQLCWPQTMTATKHYGHEPCQWRPQGQLCWPQTMTATAVTATKHYGHEPCKWRPHGRRWRPQTMTATENDGHRPWQLAADHCPDNGLWIPQTAARQTHLCPSQN